MPINAASSSNGTQAADAGCNQPPADHRADEKRGQCDGAFGG